MWPQRGSPPLCALSPHPSRAVTRSTGAHGMRSTQESAQQQVRSTQRGAQTGTPHQPRRGPPGTRDRTQSRARPRRAHGVHGPLCRAHSYRCRGEDGATAESWGAREGQEGAGGRAGGRCPVGPRARPTVGAVGRTDRPPTRPGRRWGQERAPLPPSPHPGSPQRAARVRGERARVERQEFMSAESGRLWGVGAGAPFAKTIINFFLKQLQSHD